MLAEGVWVKSSWSAYNGACVEARWRVSSHSGGTNCVESAACLCGGVLVRDSKNKAGGVLSFTPAAWGVFLDGVREGRYPVP